MPEDITRSVPQNTVPSWKTPSVNFEPNQGQSEQLPSTQSPHYIKRVLAGAIDLFLIYVLLSLFSLLFNNPSLVAGTSIAIRGFLIVFVIYFASLTTIWRGQTIGKKIFGLKIISSDGGKINWVQALVRETIGKFISVIIFNLGFIWIFIDGKGRGWHDYLAKTQVIDTKGKPQKVTVAGIIYTLTLGFVLGFYTSLSVFNFSRHTFVDDIATLLARFVPTYKLISVELSPNLNAIIFGDIFDKASNIYLLALIFLNALLPLALYLARRTRFLIVTFLLVHLTFWIFLYCASTLYLATLYSVEKRTKERAAPQPKFTVEKISSITTGYLLTSPPAGYTSGSISWSTTVKNTDYINVVYVNKTEDYAQNDLDPTNEGQILLSEFKSPNTALKCDTSTFQELNSIRYNYYSPRDQCQKLAISDKEAIIITNPGVSFNENKIIHGAKKAFIIFDKGDTRIILSFSDLPLNETTSPSDELIKLTNNLGPMTEEDIKNYINSDDTRD